MTPRSPSPLTHPYLGAQRALGLWIVVAIAAAAARGWFGPRSGTPASWLPTLAMAPVTALVAIRLGRWRHTLVPPRLLARAAVGLGILGPLVALQAHVRVVLGSGDDLVAEQLLHAGTAMAGTVLALGAIAHPPRAVTIACGVTLAGLGTVAGTHPVAWCLAPLVVASWATFASVAIRRAQRREHPASDAARHDLRAGRLVRWLCDLRDLARPLPLLTMRSDIVDVVYLNWLLPPERVAALLPAPLGLEQGRGRTVLSVLTFRHGGFGPAFLGPLRKLLPSPQQSNWRLYLEPTPAVPEGSIYFVQNPLDRWLHVIGSRLLADGLPAQRAAPFVHRRQGRRIHTRIEVAGGVDLEAEVVETDAKTLPRGWDRWTRWEDVIAYLVPQNRAVCVAPHVGGVFASTIDIPIPLDQVRPARVARLESRWLHDLVEGAEPLAFVVEQVPFRALGERPLSPR